MFYRCLLLLERIVRILVRINGEKNSVFLLSIALLVGWVAARLWTSIFVAAELLHLVQRITLFAAARHLPSQSHCDDIAAGIADLLPIGRCFYCCCYRVPLVLPRRGELSVRIRSAEV